MKTIDDIQAELRALAQELDLLKKQETGTAEQVDFPKLASMGAKYPIKPHPLAGYDAHTKKYYLIMLLSVAQYAGEQLEESLLLAHRIAFGMGYFKQGENLKEEYLSAQTLTFEQMDECATLFQNSENRLMLVLEQLLTVGAFEKQRQAALEYVSKLCVMLKVNKQDLTFLSNMAAVILTKDLKQYRCSIRNRYSIFDYYLKNLQFNRKNIHLPERIQKMQTNPNSSLGMGYFYSATLESSLKNNIANFKCEYLSARDPGRHKHTQSISIQIPENAYICNKCVSVPCSEYTFHRILGNTGFYSSLFKSSLSSEQEKQVLTLIKEALSRPIGVETHPLDSETLARAYVEKMEGGTK